MVLAVRFAPPAIVGEEGVRLCRCVVKLRQTETVGLVQQSLVEARPTDDIDVLGRIIPADIQQFLDRMNLQHVAVVDTDNSSAEPYTQEIPFEAHEAFLNRIKADIYRDFGAFNPEDISAGNVTATQINAAYQPMDEEADAFEYQVIEFVQQVLALNGMDSVPQFKRNRISNLTEQVNMVIAEAEFLDDETVLDLLPNVTPDMKQAIMERRDVEAASRLQDDGELEQRIRDILADMQQEA